MTGVNSRAIKETVREKSKEEIQWVIKKVMYNNKKYINITNK
jgi:hypothetical protein